MKVELSLQGVSAEILYHTYGGFEVNTLLISFREKRRILSTWDGYRKVGFVANTYQPPPLSKITMQNYAEFEEKFPVELGIPCDDLAFLSTGANMDNLAMCERSYEDRMVCCLATGGVGNALRAGVDEAGWIDREGEYEEVMGTINIILLTNVNLTEGAMARAIITATEAKTATLQDMDVRSSVSPENQATGTGTDNVIVVSGRGEGERIKSAGGHTKMGELIGA
ncbi:MAG: adenosylcobinamide amidohydrolase, partial [Thermoproteota archaeon]